ncbi:transcriptional regulator (plasmid) [Deinococcus peraridilitoris DSM 19664]|uniref:Transcriptional regulator n=2 Tax=Deinococcus TaxID=1298 RepID=L0A740_DEIPD|nr:transcriptional regulator [Deinococcus peraridilitoris DSM 19664]
MRRTDKRERLIQAAKTLYTQQGVQSTTLAQVALTADVPSGNLYYHFKTKDALTEAVIAAHGKDILDDLSRFNAERDPRRRLLAFLQGSLATKEQRARHGCPYAALMLELEKISSSAASSAANLLGLQLSWLELQFRALGREDSEKLALHFLAGLQGSYLLSLSRHSTQLLEQQVEQLERWVAELVAGP